MKRIVFLCSMFVFFVSCGSKKKTMITGPLAGRKQKVEKGLVYSLPRTVLTFQVRAKETKVIPGPYHKYAKRFLGIDNVPKAHNTYWHISSVEVKTGNEIDPEHYYLIERSEGSQMNFLSFGREGFILPYTIMDKRTSIGEIDAINSAPIPYYTDLSVKSFEGAKRDTVYRRVFRDSVFVRVPVLRTQVGKRTLEEKAAEAAHFLFKLRKRRFKLLAGVYEKVASGPSLEVSVRELGKLEQEYLSLFIGKRIEREVVKCFNVIPNNEDLESPRIVFRFIPKYGVLEPNDLRGRPVYLSFQQEAKTATLKNYNNLLALDKKKKKNFSLIYYRIPETSKLSLVYGKKELLKTRLPIYQFGEVMSIPTSIINGLY